MPTNADLRRFVENEGWQDKDKKSGKKKGDQHRYTLVLATGDVLFIRISHGSGGVDDPALFAEILRSQLEVTKDQFWSCVKEGTPAPRPSAAPAPPSNAIERSSHETCSGRWDSRLPTSLGSTSCVPSMSGRGISPARHRRTCSRQADPACPRSFRSGLR